MTKKKQIAAMLALSLIFGGGVALNPNQAESAIKISFHANRSGYEAENFAQEMLAMVNAERSRAGVAPLRLSRELMDACRIRAYEITKNFSHTRPDGQRFSTVVRDGYYTCGENIAAGNDTVAATMDQWMNSPGHRANILKSDYTELGVGYFYDPNSQWQHYWVQIFKRPREKSYRR